MTFADFYNTLEPKSDKGTLHDYIDGYYSTEFTNKKAEVLSIVEIGVRRGDSLHLLSNWFVNSSIFGIDNGSEMNDDNRLFVNSIPNTTMLYGSGYDIDVINKFKDNSLDYVIDDGPHTLSTQLISVNEWFKKIKSGGSLIIEDIQDWDNEKPYFDKECEKLNILYTCIDLRKNKNRYDDVLLIFKK